ncbi:MAG: response regulator transcription factor [Pseudomonadota bacterium]
MTVCAYVGAAAPGANDRIEMLRRHQIDLSALSDIDAIPQDAPLVILDGTGQDRVTLDAALAALKGRGILILVLFRLAHGETFRNRREALLAQGAHDVMEADAPSADLLVRTRALMLGARQPFVLVVEDTEKTGSWAVDELKAAGMDALYVKTLAEARACFEARTVDALVVDRGLPDGDGLEFVAFLRRNGIRTPALLFTAMDDVEDRIMGLRDAGADDYICKPVHGDELVARVQVLLRPRDVDENLIFGPLELARRDRMARWRGERIDLRPKECDMLIYLAEREGLPIPKRMIYADVWDKVFMDVGSNPVTAARHRLVRDFKSFLAARGEVYPDFIATDEDAYCFRAEPLLRLPGPDPDA